MGSALRGQLATVLLHHMRAHDHSQTQRTNWLMSDTALLVKIRAVFFEMKGAYSGPRIWRKFAVRQIRAGKERVRKLMHANGFRAQGNKKLRVTTDSGNGLPVSPNLLERRFDVEEPNRVWGRDIIYVSTDEG